MFAKEFHFASAHGGEPDDLFESVASSLFVPIKSTVDPGAIDKSAGTSEHRDSFGPESFMAGSFVNFDTNGTTESKLMAATISLFSVLIDKTNSL